LRAFKRKRSIARPLLAVGGYTDPRKSLAKGLQGKERGNIDREESWEGFSNEKGSSTIMGI
jgi:hypothetical protein